MKRDGLIGFHQNAYSSHTSVDFCLSMEYNELVGTEKELVTMRTQNDVRVTIRVDKDLKERAESLFDRLGMNMTTALNVFLRKAVDEEAIPFVISAKSSRYGNGYSPSDVTGIFEAAVRNEIADKQRTGQPIARYDATSKQAYLEFADGTREYVNE